MDMSLPQTYSGYVIATQPGSLPMGGTVPDTPIYALRRLPAGLLASAAAMEPAVRRDIDIGGQLAFVIGNILSAEACRALIGIGEHFGFRDEAPGISTPPGMRMNQALHWMADAELLELIHQTVAPLLPQTLHGKALWPRLSQRINLYKYRKGDVFNRHTDGDWPGYGFSTDQVGIEEWLGGRSQLSMLLYLNGPEDGVQGGATRLYGDSGVITDVIPKAGSALFFQHGFRPGSVVHAGTQVGGDTPKYVARINVLYDRA
ncbi:2OG-Fe(II) oxygenase [Duganella aceris]|uniref:Prolyl 4-hydroxylase alpha subunit domain-containing protein n=1 Tax=Duganella aceris TaxID=2703883 RepID=A0ABX0FVP3_9BURK|nr:2OG-Fe(II) oxygenase [Duganella aceris]NGZ88516.1 hypothetical protein [Duganella aceris]